MQTKTIEKELKKIEKAENRMQRQAERRSEPLWRKKLEEIVPDKVMSGLQKAFSKAFYLIFEKGTAVIERTYDREAMEKDFQIRDYAIDLKGGRKEIGNLKRAAAGQNMLGTAFTAAEGIGLGVLGIGLPDIAIWTGVLLRSVYEMAMKYGYGYETPEEKMFILRMLETAMLTGEEWTASNARVDACLEQAALSVPMETEIKRQIEKTADAFAADMLVTKFIQGLPLVGAAGGAWNPVYYRRVMGYVQLKYRKRYFTGKLKDR